MKFDSMKNHAVLSVSKPWYRLLGACVAILLFAGFSPRAQAIITLNSASFSNLQAALSYTGHSTPQVVILAFNGTITMTYPITIAGNIILEAPTNYTATLSGGGTTRLFQVNSNNYFTVSNITLSGGSPLVTNGIAGYNGFSSYGAGNDGGSGLPGGNALGGAIYNLGNLTVYKCSFVTNNARGATGGSGGNGGSDLGNNGNAGSGGPAGNGGLALGGAIYNAGSMFVSNSSFIGNYVIGGNGGLGGTNGAGGGGYFGAGGAGNIAEGGAIYNAGYATNYACTFAGNYSTGGNSQTAGGKPGGNGSGPNGAVGGHSLGGGVYNSGPNLLINCTFSANQVSGGAGANGGAALTPDFSAGKGGNGGDGVGGAIFTETNGLTTIQNCTLSAGLVYAGTNGVSGTPGVANNPGIPGHAYGANICSYGKVILRASILAYPTNATNLTGNFKDAGYNICSDYSIGFTQTTSFTNLDPLLAPLANYGGDTLTFDLKSDSPAIDAIPNLPLTNYPAFDQRAYPRPIPTGSYADIGAVEHGQPTFSVSGLISPTNYDYSNVYVVATGTQGLSYSSIPNPDGTYLIPGMQADTYAVSATITNGYTFAPTTTNVILNLTTPAAVVNFTAAAAYAVGGTVSNLSSSVSVTLYTLVNGNITASVVTTTDTNGYYVFTNVAAGNFTIQPQGTSTNIYSPATLAITVPPTYTNYNFLAVPVTYSVSGGIVGGPGVVAVTATANGSSTPFGTVLSDANGSYTFSSLPVGVYSIRPIPTNGYSFSPANINVSLLSGTNISSFTGVNGSAYTISGQVVGYHGIVNLQATGQQYSYSGTSDTNGNYSIFNVPGGSYAVTPGTVAKVTFQPSSLSLSLSGNLGSQNFNAYPLVRQTNSKPSYSNSIFRFSVTNGAPLMKYRVQSRTNLFTGSWTNVVTNYFDSTGSASFTTTNGGGSNIFFRTVSP